MVNGKWHVKAVLSITYLVCRMNSSLLQEDDERMRAEADAKGRALGAI